MAEAAEAKKRRMVDPVEARLSLIEGTIVFSAELGPQFENIRVAITKAAEEVKKAVESAPVHDKGRLIAALDALQTAKNNARDSLLLPHA